MTEDLIQRFRASIDRGGEGVPDETNGRELHPRVSELARGRNFAALTTLLPGGHPQTQVMWVDADGDHVLINTEVHRQKFRNVERDPRVTLMIWDKEDPYSFVEVRGEVVEKVGGRRRESTSTNYHRSTTAGPTKHESEANGWCFASLPFDR
jgi:PPOX class probable F420-dependent enzyme